MEPETAKKGWIYKLRKEALVREMQTLGLETDGTLDELRSRMSKFLEDHPEALQPLEHGLGPPEETRRRVLRAPSPIPTEVSYTPDTINQIRKWGCRFDGRDPVDFLERIEELQECYGLTAAQMLAGLPELLKGDPLLWYRNHRHNWMVWADFTRAFQEQYLPRRYRCQLLRELQNRRQNPGEPYARYATAVLTLMRRAGRLNMEEQVEQLYEGLHPDYQLYVRRDDVRSVRELTTRATEYEAITAKKQEIRPINRPRPAVAAATYQRDTCCWRCKEPGHTRRNCRRPARKFCSECGKDGVLTRDCHPRQGNAPPTEDVRASPRSPPECQ